MEEFGFIFNAAGNAWTKVRDLGSLMVRVNEEMRRSARAAKQPRDELGRFTSTGIKGVSDLSNTWANLNSAFQESVAHLSQVRGLFFDMVVGIAGAGIKSAAAVESSNARLRFGLRKIDADYDAIIKKIDEASLRTVLTRQDIVDMTSSFGVQGINIWTDAMEQLQYTSAEGIQGTTSAIDVLNDAVAFSGKNASRIMMSVREVVSEQKVKTGRWLADDLNIGGKELEKWNKALGKAKNQQEAFEITMMLMAERVGGATESVSQTLEFITQQVDDWIQKVNSSLFTGALPLIRDLIAYIGEKVLALTEPGGAFEKLGKTFTEIFAVLTAVGRYLVDFFVKVIEWFADNPWAVKTAAAFVGLLGTLITIMSVIGSVAGLIVAIKTVIGLLPMAIAALKSGFMFLAPVLFKIALVVGLIAGGVMLLSRLFLGGKDWADTWERLKLVVSAIWEGIKGMTGDTTTLSAETARALERAGLLDFVWNFLRFLHRVKVMAIAVWETFMMYWPAIKESGQRIFEALGRAVDSVRRMFGLTSKEGQAGMTGAADSSMKSWVDAGVGIAEVLVTIVLFVVKIVEWIAIAIEKVTAFYEKLTEVGEALGDMAFDIFGDEEVVVKANGERDDAYYTQQGEVQRGAPGFLPDGYGAQGQVVTGFVSRSAQEERSQQAIASAMNNLNEVQKDMLLGLMNERMGKATALSEADAKRNDKQLADLVGAAVAKQLQANPQKIFIDGKPLSDLVMERALSESEAAR